MKNRILLTVILVAMATTAWTQPSITLLTFQGYTFADRFTTQFGTNGRIEDGFQWGGGLEIGFSDEAALELIYQNIKTEVTYQGSNQQYTGNAGINYMMLGGTRYALFNDKISGFGSLDLGAAWSNPDASLDSESVTKFAWGGRLGLRFLASEKVSIRLHAQLLSPVQWAGAGFFFGTGGASAGVSTGSTIYQFNLGGGVNFKLK